jgi:hypothetical protein
LEISTPLGLPVNWQVVFEQYPGKYIAGSSQIYLTQPNGSAVIGTFAINDLDNSILTINWNPDTLVSNTGIDSQGLLDYQANYNASGSNRPSSPGTFDAIVNPQTFNPGTISTGTRYLLVDDIGAVVNQDGADAWKSSAGVDFIALANDIVEWSGTAWHVIFAANQESNTMVWQTNIYTGVQYLWNGVSWNKSFEGEYGDGEWKIVL